jgi:hypothetical protein
MTAGRPRWQRLDEIDFGDGERQPVDQGEGPRAGQDGGLLSGQRVDGDDQAVPVADLGTRRAGAEPSISARTSRS